MLPQALQFPFPWLSSVLAHIISAIFYLASSIIFVSMSLSDSWHYDILKNTEIFMYILFLQQSLLKNKYQYFVNNSSNHIYIYMFVYITWALWNILVYLLTCIKFLHIYIKLNKNFILEPEHMRKWLKP